MALKPLASITTLRDVIAYAKGSATTAAKKCPAVAAKYSEAASLGASYLTFENTTLEISYVEMVRQMILDTNKAWYSAGCASPGGGAEAEPAAAITTTEDAAAAEAEAGVPGAQQGNILGTSGWIWMAAGAGALLYFAFAKKGKKRTKRNPCRSRRRRR